MAVHHGDMELPDDVVVEEHELEGVLFTLCVATPRNRSRHPTQRDTHGVLKDPHVHVLACSA